MIRLPKKNTHFFPGDTNSMFLSRVGGSFKSSSAVDPVDVDRSLEKVQISLRRILGGDVRNLSFEEVYTAAYNLVIQRHGNKLLELTTGNLRAHIKRCVSCLKNEIGEREFSVLVAAEWMGFVESMRMIRDVLMYMDRNYLQQYNRPALADIGYKLFQEEILMVDEISSRILRGLMTELTEYRRTRGDSSLLASLISIFTTTSGAQDCSDLVGDALLPELIRTTIHFYNDQGDEFIRKTHDILEYSKWALEAYNCEKRIFSSQPVVFENQVIQALDTCLIDRHCEALLNEQFGRLLNKNSIDSLRLVYQVFSRTLLGRATMQHIFRTELKSRLTSWCGKEINIAKLAEILLEVESLIKISSLGGKKEFATELESAAEAVFSENAYELCSHLSHFIDVGIRKGDCAIVDSALAIFKYISSKDVFEAYYRLHLGRRLLGSSPDLELEQVCSAKFRQECGPTYCAKIDGMIADLYGSKDLMSEWRRAQGDSSCTLKVLSTSVWSNLRNIPNVESLPPLIKTGIEGFTDFYTGKFSGRKLTWVLSQGNAEISHISAGCLLTVSTVQALVLNLFNGAEKLSLDTIISKTGICFDDLKRHIVSLYVNPKCSILKKTSHNANSKPAQLDMSDIFEINESFTATSRHVKVPLIVDQAATVPDITGPGDADTDAGIHQVVEEDRKHLIEAALVRLMKARRQISHSELSIELTKQLGSRFVPSADMLKARVENLIDREFIARDNDDVNLYYYVA